MPPAAMPAYGAQHLGAVAGIALLIAVLLLRARRCPDPGVVQQWMRRGGWALLLASILWTAWGFLPASWDVEQSLPLHYSDALRVVTALALIFRWGWAVAISCFGGLTLNLQSILTPALEYVSHPVVEYLAYWVLHGAVLAAPVIMIWGLGWRPTWRGYGLAVAAAIGWAVLALAGNAVTGANYAYLSRAPESASILDLLGGWPIYILWEVLLVAGVWAAMTWAWSPGAHRTGSAVLDPRGLVRISAAARPPRGPGVPARR